MVVIQDGVIYEGRPRTVLEPSYTHNKAYSSDLPMGFLAGSVWCADILINNTTMSPQLKIYFSSFAGLFGAAVTEGFTILLPKKLKVLGTVIPATIAAISAYNIYRKIKDRRKPVYTCPYANNNHYFIERRTLTNER
jgi:hypothetical protein